MNWHPTEDDLVLHYYREQTEMDADRLDDHLHICSTCGETWRQVRETMAALDRADVPEPDAAFESRIWARVAAELPRRPRQWTLRQVVMVGAWAAVVGIIAGAGYTWRTVRVPAAESLQVVETTEPSEMRERVLLTALNDHFSQTEVLLVELMNAPATQGELDFERSTADELVSSGRLYRQTAAENGDALLAGMLDDIEGVLTEVARSPERVDKHQFQVLRARIEDDDLLFKVRAVTTAVRGRRRALMQQQ